jgi:hypothetical protein
MNLQAIKSIVENAHADESWEVRLLKEIANDSQAIWHVLTMLAAEREKNGALITDLNFELSRAHLALTMPKQQPFVYEEVIKFYKQGRINHCFKMEGLE